MNDPFSNIYETARYADAYARLEFPGTYYLAFRDLPAVFARHATGRRALDFGCGAGRSTRFLERCGFDAVGVDISRDMVAKAREADPAGDYRVIADGDFASLAPGSFDLALSAFTFDNVPTAERKVGILAGLARLLAPKGRLVNLVSSPEIYVNEWASFSTRAFPGTGRRSRATWCGSSTWPSRTTRRSRTCCGPTRRGARCTRRPASRRSRRCGPWRRRTTRANG